MGSILGIAAGQAAINTASGIIGQTVGRIFAPKDRKNQLEQQAKLNEQAYDINNRMAEANYERDMRMWEATNYQAQKEQLEKAGLNPGLLYGMSGGGGSTANAAGAGSGVGAGQAESSRQGMGIMPIDMMQLQTAQAQKELIQAQTENVKANTQKTSGVDTELGHTQIGKLIAETSNEKAKQALTEVQTTIATIQAAIQSGTQMEQMDKIAAEARNAEQTLLRAIRENSIGDQTMDTVVKMINTELATAILKNQKTEVEIKQIVNAIDQKWEEINIQHTNASTRQKEYELQKWIHDVKDTWKLGSEVATDLIGTFLKIPKTGPKRTTTETYSEKGYKHSTTTHE